MKWRRAKSTRVTPCCSLYVKLFLKKKKKESVKSAALACLSRIKGNVSTNWLVNLKRCADVEQRFTDYIRRPMRTS